VFRTVRHLKLRQVVHRLFVIAKPRFLGKTPTVRVRPTSRVWVTPVSKHQTMHGPREFRILNENISVNVAADWNDPRRDKLLLYHLHYLDDLTATGAADRKEWHSSLIDLWIEHNPPLAGNGWEPYPLSLRLVNCIKWALAGNKLSNAQLESLWTQAHVMKQSVEHHLQANHLLANAKALYFGGCFFAGQEADRWLRAGTRLLSSQIAEQILCDGGHFERSPMYQSVTLDDMLDIINIGQSFDIELPAGVKDVVIPMLGWLAQMTHPDGEPAYFNDSVAANAVSLADLHGYSNRLGFAAGIHEKEGLVALENSGYVRYKRGALKVIVDAGEIGPDYQPGHAHCDCLSFELSVRTNRVFVNTGVSTYNANARRHLERGTESHNTVSVAGEEQSEIWGAFRVGRRARPVDVDVGESHVSAAHDGYQRLGILHRRRFDFLADRIEIKDALESDSPSIGVAHFHCHPGLNPVVSGTDIEIAGLRLSLENAEKIEVLPYEYCEGFNVRRPGKKITVTFKSTLTTCIYYEDSLYNG